MERAETSVTQALDTGADGLEGSCSSQEMGRVNSLLATMLFGDSVHSSPEKLRGTAPAVTSG